LNNPGAAGQGAVEYRRRRSVQTRVSNKEHTMSSKLFLAAAALATSLGFSNAADARPRAPAPEVGVVIGGGGVRIDVRTGLPIPILIAPHRVWIPGHWEHVHRHRSVWVPGHYDIR
jgi:hypothetical protein